jgi:hypothetical protein
MEQKIQPFETEGHDLSGYASLEFYENENMNSLAMLIPGMELDRFEPVALKIFLTGENPLITLYALEKNGQHSDMDKDKLPVKKFKAPISWIELFKYVKRFDLVVNNGKYNIEDFRVINK